MYKPFFHDELYTVIHLWHSNNMSNLDYKLKIKSTIPGEWGGGWGRVGEGGGGWGRVAATIHKLHQISSNDTNLSNSGSRSDDLQEF